MKQIPFTWAEPTALGERSPVAFAPETTQAATELMARVMVAVVQATQEGADER